MKIYTKTGDTGTTSLFGGKRVSKDDLRVEVYGNVDELNSLVGLCRSLNRVKEVDRILNEIQNDLFRLGADLATPITYAKGKTIRIGKREAIHLEHHIDVIDSQLAPLKNFILPGGARSAAILHVARSVCRRTERLVVRLSRSDAARVSAVIYLNRLSDLLFVLARWVNARNKTDEVRWRTEEKTSRKKNRGAR